MNNTEEQILRISKINEFLSNFEDDVKKLGEFDEKVLYSMMVCGSFLSDLLDDNSNMFNFESIDTLVDELVDNNIVSKYFKDLLFISKNTDHFKLIYNSIKKSGISYYDLIMSIRTEMTIYIDELTPINGFNDSWVAFRNVLDTEKQNYNPLVINASRYMFNMFDLYISYDDKNYDFETKSFCNANIWEADINQMVLAYVRADFLNRKVKDKANINFNLNVLLENPNEDTKEYDVCVIGDYATGYDKHIDVFTNKSYVKAPHGVLKHVKNNTIYSSLKLCVNALNLISDNGSIAIAVEKKAAVAMKGNDLVRKSLVQQGCLESSTSLPNSNEDFFDNSALLFILSKRNNDGVLVLAGEDKDEYVANEVISETIPLSTSERVNLYEKENHTETQSVRDLVSNTIDPFTGDTVEQYFAYYMQRVSVPDLEDSLYNCIPEHYIMPYAACDRETEYLKFVATKLKRGHTPKDIEKRLQQAQLESKSTNMRYLTISDITDGQIHVEKLREISNLENNERDKVLQEGDIVITKNGNPYYVAVAENLNNEEVLANNNLYILRCNENWDPYYVKMYLESNEGHAQIQRSLPVWNKYEFSMGLLEDLHIPIMAIEKQKELASEYKKYLHSINESKKHIYDLKNLKLFEEIKKANQQD